MIAALLLAAAAGVADPCALPEPAAQPDARAAAAYAAIGDEERARGAPETAATAYREALRNAPADPALLAAFAAACAPPASPASRFDEGRERFEAGDCDAARAAFDDVRARGPDPGASLLEGICAYEQADDARALPLLEEAQAEPRVASTAKLFLGLIALRHGEAASARSLFDAATRSGNEALASSASRLLRLADEGGRLSVALIASTGADSNADLAPDGAPDPSGSADASGALAVGLVYRPTGEQGFYARVLGSYRKLARFDAYDAGVAQAAAGFQLGFAPRHFAAEYAWETAALGRAAYLSAHRLAATGRTTAGVLSVAATYAVRFESFLAAANAGYSGVRHAAELEASLRLDERAVAGLGYQGVLDLADDPGLVYTEHGPRAFARLQITRSVVLGLDLGLLLRRYDAVDAALGTRRADTYLDGGLAAEVELSRRFSVRASANARRALSNVSDFVYTQLGATLSLAYSAGLL